MAYLDLGPAIVAVRARPEEFEFSGNTLHHIPSRHSFYFLDDGDVRVNADCNCATLQTSREQGRAFQAAFKEWHATYWRPVEINREFASHFAPPSLWRRLAVWLLIHLLSRRPSAVSVKAMPVMPRPSVF